MFVVEEGDGGGDIGSLGAILYGSLGAIKGSLGAIIGSLGAIIGSFGAIMGYSEALYVVLDPSHCFGAITGSLGAILVRVLRPLQIVSGSSQSVLGPAQVVLGRLFALPRAS